MKFDNLENEKLFILNNEIYQKKDNMAVGISTTAEIYPLFYDKVKEISSIQDIIPLYPLFKEVELLIDFVKVTNKRSFGDEIKILFYRGVPYLIKMDNIMFISKNIDNSTNLKKYSEFRTNKVKVYKLN
jgi:hypothetical protein